LELKSFGKILVLNLQNELLIRQDISIGGGILELKGPTCEV
jgi:hypothetical protein